MRPKVVIERGADVASDDAFLARATVLRVLETLNRPPATLEENGLAHAVRALLVLPRCGGRRALGKGRKAHRGPCGLPAMIPAYAELPHGAVPAWLTLGILRLAWLAVLTDLVRKVGRKIVHEAIARASPGVLRAWCAIFR